MRAGELRHRITLKQPVTTTNANEEDITTYATVATVWAAIDWGSGRRYEAAKQLDAEVQGVIRIRYRSDVKAYWRIEYDGRTFEIISLANVQERGRELVLTCKEALD
jgi:SPP1 family predicted phage head-tail adaptor